MRTLRQLDECGEEPGVVQHGIEPLIAQHGLGALELRAGAAGEQTHRELRIISGERVTNVRQDH
jgi:hypothetical protein